MKKGFKSMIVLATIFLLGSFAAQAQYDVTVAKDGSGNFTTLQAAIDAAPAGQTTPYKIFIKKGKYVEKVTVPATKTFLYLIGESINETIISWNDYTGMPNAPADVASFTFNANDCAMMNLTVENSFGRQNDGPQALAVQSNSDRLIYKNCRFISGQDTFMANGAGKRQYFRNCYFDGNTDFIYGAAIAAFDSCVIFCRDRLDGSAGGYLTAADTPPLQTYGYVFRNCLLPLNNGTTTYTLGRPWGNDAQPYSSKTKVVFLNCRMGKNISPQRWSPWSIATDTTVITYAEYNTMYFNGKPVDLSKKLSWTQQFDSTTAAPYLVNSNLFGTWDPCAVLASACTPMDPFLSLSNIRVNRNTTGSTIKFNLCWPVNGATLELLRSTDSLNFATTATSVSSFTTVTDTCVAYQFKDVLPAAGVSYFYRVRASKAGLESASGDTMLKVNTSIPLSGDFRSTGSGGWSNNASAISTLTSGAVTAVTITSSPTGYTAVPTVTFAAAPTGGTRATGTATVTGGIVTGVTITNAGAGYTAAPSVTFSTTGVGGNSIWEKYNSSSNVWVPVAFGTGPSSVNVTIQTGNTITLNGLASATNVTIQSGATLNSTGNAAGTVATGPQTFRIGSGTSPVSAVLQNDGMFGSTTGTGDGIICDVWGSCKDMLITGSGTTSIARLRASPGNLNTLNIVIDQNMSFGYNNVCFTGFYNSSANLASENCTITINPGSTVTIASPTGGIHGSANLSTNPQGNITYNINGILDLSALTSTQNFVPSTNALSTVSVTTMNINGTVILGKGGINTISSVATNPATARININDGGVLDASLANTLKTTTAANGSFFVIGGSGLLKRTVGANATLFPIGTSATSYTPVLLSNSSTADAISAGVNNVFSTPLANPLSAVGKQWNIIPTSVSGDVVNASFGWGTADQGTTFLPTGSLLTAQYNGSAWVGTATTIDSGAGTLASPYMASVTGLTTFGNFAIANASALPLKLVSFNAAYANKHVKIGWATSNEISLSSFAIERSIDGKSFTSIGTMKAKNIAGSSNYSFVDANVDAGVVYYRLKSINTNGTYAYSNTVSVRIAKLGLSIYPNPVTSAVTVSYDKVGANAVLKVYSVDGKQLMVKPLVQNATQSAVDLSGLAKGSYLLTITNGSETQRATIIKQ